MEYTHDDFWKGNTNEDFWKGQQEINRELCRVDWKLIKALDLINAILMAMKTPVDDTLLKQLKQAIAEVYVINSKVAEIKPPGCAPPLAEEPPEPPEPPYTTSATQRPTS